MKIHIFHRPGQLETGGSDIYTAQRFGAALERAGCEVHLFGADQPDTDADVCWLWCACSPDWGLPLAQHVKAAGVPLLVNPVWWSRKPRCDFYGIGGDIAPGYTPAVAQTLALSDYITPYTHWGARQCWDLVPRHPAFVMPRGFDGVNEAVSAMPIEDRVCCLGRIEMNKNQVQLALACRALGVPLVLIGAPGDASMVAKCKALGAEVVGLCAHNRAMELLATSRVHALPSFGEDGAQANFEANALGVPGVMGWGAEYEIFGPGGIYCDPANWRDIAEAIRLAWDQPRGPWAQVKMWNGTAAAVVPWLEREVVG